MHKPEARAQVRKGNSLQQPQVTGDGRQCHGSVLTSLYLRKRSELHPELGVQILISKGNYPHRSLT